MTATSVRPPFAQWMQSTNEITKTFLSASNIPDMINLAGGLPAPEIFPTQELAEFARDAVLKYPNETLAYSPVDGLAALRDALAQRFSSPQLRVTRENVIVTSAGMQALDLVGRVLLSPSATIAVQAPTYLGAIDAWRPYLPTYRQFTFENPPSDFDALLRGAQFAYTVPNFSNPTGKLVGLTQREAIVAAAHTTGTWLVEDDPYGTLHYDAESLPRLLQLSAIVQSNHSAYDGPVVYMGTLSKEMVPGLRIGWVIASPEMIKALTMAKQGTDMCTSGLTQRVALAALTSGLMDRKRFEMVALYKARRDALCAAMDEHLHEWFEWEKPVGGMFVWAIARDRTMNTDALMHKALKAGVCVSPSSVFDPDGRDRSAIRINFTFNSPERLQEGVRRLASALRSTTHR